MNQLLIKVFFGRHNYASLEKLPVLLYENNTYSVYSPQRKRQAGDSIISKILIDIQINGNDSAECYLKIEK